MVETDTPVPGTDTIIWEVQRAVVGLPGLASRPGPLTAWPQARALRDRLGGSRRGTRFISLTQSQLV